MDSNRSDILLEDINHKFDILVDGIKSMRQEMQGLAKQSDLQEVKQSAHVITKVATDTNHQVQDHEQRISHLEARA